VKRNTAFGGYFSEIKSFLQMNNIYHTSSQARYQTEDGIMVNLKTDTEKTKLKLINLSLCFYFYI